MEKCPECGKKSVTFDEYLGRKLCLMRACCWSELSVKHENISIIEDNDGLLIDKNDELDTVIAGHRRFK